MEGKPRPSRRRLAAAATTAAALGVELDQSRPAYIETNIDLMTAPITRHRPHLNAHLAQLRDVARLVLNFGNRNRIHATIATPLSAGAVKTSAVVCHCFGRQGMLSLDALPVIGIVGYGILLVASLCTVTSCRRRRRAGWLLILLALSRVLWELALLMDESGAWQLVLSATTDSVANAAFYAWMASLVLRALPSKKGAGEFGTTLWRAGQRLTLCTQAAVAIWLLAVVVLSSVELACLMTFRSSRSGLDTMCALPGNAERVGLAVVSLFGTFALWILYSRVLQLHKELAAPIGKPSRALLNSLGACALCLLGRAVTLFIEAAVDETGGGTDASGCTVASAGCRHLGSSISRALITVFAYWLPEWMTPLVLFRLASFAARLHRQRSGGGKGSRLLGTSLRGTFFSSGRGHLLRSHRQRRPSHAATGCEMREVAGNAKLIGARSGNGDSSSSDGISGSCGESPERSGKGSPIHAGALSSARRSSKLSRSFKEKLGNLLLRRNTTCRMRFEYNAMGKHPEGRVASASMAPSVARGSAIRDSAARGSSADSSKASASGADGGAALGLGVDVLEVMEESPLLFAVAAAYIPLAVAELRKRLEGLREEVQAEASRRGILSPAATAEERRIVTTSLLAAWQGVGVGGSVHSSMSGSMSGSVGNGQCGDTTDGTSGGTDIESNAAAQLAAAEVAASDASAAGGESTDAVLHELLLDVSAALDCPRLDWLRVLHHMHSGLLNALSEPLDAATDPSIFLPAFGLPELTFKPSRLKDAWPLAFLCTNCHVQRMLVSPRLAHNGSDNSVDDLPGRLSTASTNRPSVASNSSTSAGADVITEQLKGQYEWVTCGCAAAHPSKFRSGGLSQIDAKVIKIAEKLASASTLPPAAVRHLTQRKEWLLFQRSRRVGICVSQALCAIITLLHASIRSALAKASGGREEFRQWAAVGFLVGWESLLSTNGKENKMLGDTWGAVQALRKLSVRIVRRPGEGPPAVRIERDESADTESARGGSEGGGGSCGAGGAERGGSDLPTDPPLLVTLCLPPSEFMELPSALRLGRSFPVRVCLFSQGVNEQQTLANATGQTGLQEIINAKSLTWLDDYASAYADYLAGPSPTGIGSTKRTSSVKQLSQKHPSMRSHKATPRGSLTATIGAAFGKVRKGATDAAAKPPLLARGMSACARVAEDGDGGDAGGAVPEVGEEEEEAGDAIDTPAPRGLAAHIPAGGFVVDSVVYLPMDACLGTAASSSSPSGGRGGGQGSGSSGGMSSSAMLWELRLLLAELRTVVEAVTDSHTRRKDTRVLTLSSQCVRLLSGGRIVSCKSGKDRTSMSVTAEQVTLLRRHHRLPGHAMGTMLEAMRRDGCRMENTKKNVGKRGYAFNSLQRVLLPRSLRPDSNTTCAGLQS